MPATQKSGKTISRGKENVVVKKSKLLCGIALIVIVSNSVMAQEGPGPQRGAGATSHSADAVSPLEEITVTAQRREEASSKVPLSVTAFGTEQLAERSITTERDLQSSVPGLVVRTNSSESQLTYSIRGQSVDPFSGVSPAVLVYTNDVEANTGAPGSFYDLSSVQVLKGPQGTLFGRNTTGGAILYTTTMPGKTLGGYFTQRVGNLGMLESLGAIDLPFSDAVRLRLAGDYYSRDGYQKNIYTGQELGGSKRRSVRATLVIGPTAASKARQSPSIANRTGIRLLIRPIHTTPVARRGSSRRRPAFTVPGSTPCSALGRGLLIWRPIRARTPAAFPQPLLFRSR